VSKVVYFIGCTSLLLFSTLEVSLAQEVVMPQGSAPPALVSGYFPDRLHEFVWRNWDAVEPIKLAKIIGASVEQVTILAESMGLPRIAVVPPDQKSRGYITLIRRNWHLLPYEQLIELVEMTPQQLAFTLREDDFLWVKLGRLKPKCEPLRFIRLVNQSGSVPQIFDGWSSVSSATSCAQRPSRGLTSCARSPAAQPPDSHKRNLRRATSRSRFDWCIRTWRCTAIRCYTPSSIPIRRGFSNGLRRWGLTEFGYTPCCAIWRREDLSSPNSASITSAGYSVCGHSSRAPRNMELACICI